MVLVLFDTDRIKDYVFATNWLREIRGASACLDVLNDEKIEKIVVQEQGQLVYAGGGSAMAILDNQDQADRVIQKVQREYRRRTHAAEITCASIEMNDPAIRFGEYVQRLNYELRALKDQKTHKCSWRTSPILKACNSCGRYPAAHHVQHPEETFICSPCKIKQKISRRVRDGSFKSRLRELLDYAHRKNEWQTLSLEDAPEDFNKIGESATPTGYIGFIYCDGNRMGSLFRNLKECDDFKTLSEGVRRILSEITFDALLHHFPNPPSNKPLPFEIIFIGGDDLMIVAAADRAMEIALYLCREFEQRTKPILEKVGFPDGRKSISLSAAVVLAHASLPIYHLQSVAEDLLKSAKRRSLKILEESRDDTGCIDFHVVTASASEMPSLMRKSDWSLDRKMASERTLTERPYTWEEIQTLIARIRDLKATNFPQSKLQMLYEAMVDQSKAQAMFTWAFVAGRANRDQAARLFEFFPTSNGHSMWPWQKREPDKLSTPMLDVVELYDFIE